VEYNTSTGGATSYEWVYRGNGPFDPEVAAGGGQPTGYDQWSAFYSSQRTHGSSITIVGTNGSTGSQAGLTLLPTNAATGTTQALTLTYPYVKHTVAGQLNSDNKFKLYNRMTTVKLEGIQSIEGDDAFASVIGALPANQWYWNFGVFSTGGAITGLALQFIATIIYDIEYFGRIDLAGS